MVITPDSIPDLIFVPGNSAELMPIFTFCGLQASAKTPCRIEQDSIGLSRDVWDFSRVRSVWCFLQTDITSCRPFRKEGFDVCRLNKDTVGNARLHPLDRFSKHDYYSTSKIVSFPNRVLLEQSRRQLSGNVTFGMRTHLVRSNRALKF